MVKTPLFHCCGPRFNHWSGNCDLASRGELPKTQNKTKIKNYYFWAKVLKAISPGLCINETISFKKKRNFLKKISIHMKRKYTEQLSFGGNMEILIFFYIFSSNECI